MITNIRGGAVTCTALALSLGLAGCDAASTTGAAIAAAGVPAVGAVLTVAPPRTAGFAVCASGGFFRPGLALVVSSPRATVSVDSVTLHLNDGSNLGGPGVTVPQPELAAGAQTLVFAGASRTFFLTPVFGCGVSAPHTIHADVGVVEVGGTRAVIRATVVLP